MDVHVHQVLEPLAPQATRALVASSRLDRCATIPRVKEQPSEPHGTDGHIPLGVGCARPSAAERVQTHYA
eukprot:5499505-Amphidinium_carterae.1